MTTTALKIKLLVCGAANTGKTSLMNRFVSDTFTEDTQSTIGTDFRSKDMIVDGVKVKCAIWDTAGNMNLRSLGSSFYRNANCALFVYDVTSKSSFEELPAWLKEARSYVPDLVPMLVANKIDKLDEGNNETTTASSSALDAEAMAWRAQEKSRAEEFARENQMLYVRTSAKTREGVQHAFEAVAAKVAQTPEFRKQLDALNNNTDGNATNSSGGVNLAQRPDQPDGPGGCLC